jgi:hypothetical protein
MQQERRHLQKGVLVLSALLLLLIVIGVATNVFMDKKNDKVDKDALTLVSSSTLDSKTCLYEIKSMLSQVSDPLSFLGLVYHQACALEWLFFQDTILQSMDGPNLLHRYFPISVNVTTLSLLRESIVTCTKTWSSLTCF